MTLKSIASDGPGLAEDGVALDLQEDMDEVLRNQTSLAALYEQGHSNISERLDSLESKLAQGFEAVIANISNEKAQETALTYKEKVLNVKLAYNQLAVDIAKAAGMRTNQQSRILADNVAQKNATEADREARYLYAWATTRLPNVYRGDRYGRSTGMSKQEKLRAMPYLVAMAYAVRVRMDARMVESHSLRDKDHRRRHSASSREDVNNLTDLLRAALMATVRDTSLLEMALDYHQAVRTYAVLINKMEQSVQKIGEIPQAIEEEELQAWDDGLSDIRSLVRRGAYGITTIDLDDADKRAWWLSFIDIGLGERNIDDVKHTVPARELCLMLGYTHDGDDSETASFHLAPEYEAALFGLSSAHSMRNSLLNKLGAVLGVAPDQFQSVARINTGEDAPRPFGCRSALPEPLSPLSPRLVLSLDGHSNSVYGVAVSLDGQRIVSSSCDSTAKVWSVPKGRKLRSFKAHSSHVNSVAFFSDGKRAVTCGADSTLRIFNVITGRQIRALVGHGSQVYQAAVAPDDCRVASASAGTTIKLWNACSGQCDATLRGHSDCVQCVAWSEDGQFLASGSADKTIKVWSARDHSLLRTIDGGHKDVVSALAFAGDMLVSSSWDKTIGVWRWQSGALQRRINTRTARVYSIAVFPDNERVASCGDESTICIWNLRSGEYENALEGHTNSVRSVVVSRDGHTLVSGGDDHTVKVWELRE